MTERSAFDLDTFSGILAALRAAAWDDLAQQETAARAALNFGDYYEDFTDAAQQFDRQWTVRKLAALGEALLRQRPLAAKRGLRAARAAYFADAVARLRRTLSRPLPPGPLDGQRPALIELGIALEMLAADAALQDMWEARAQKLQGLPLPVEGCPQ